MYDNKPVLYGISIDSFVFDEKRLGLFPPERTQKIRVCSFLDDRKRSFAAGLLLEAALGKDVAFGVRSDDNGKPYIEGGPYFSISHSGKWVILAVCEEPAGVDIEIRSLSRNTEGIARRAFHPLEREAARGNLEMFYKTWTAKESYIKMLGKNLSTLPDFRVIFNGNEGRVEGNPDAVIRVFDDIDGYTATVCASAGIGWPGRILIPD
ncbi:MAG: 4'-phosphopantetheinyl transferase superfamily protein [Spirochaetaceae bacterium]|nr:4'-phosphopantetheinyl transferase superfamily protein [Spirochaetaceae bacterium]